MLPVSSISILGFILFAIMISNGACYVSALTSIPKVPALLVFGDSIVDTGNNNYLPTVGKCNFPPYGRDFPGARPTGRYSNGKVPCDIMAEELGIKQFVPPYLDPTLTLSDLATGVSFASGAAGYDPLSAQTASALTLENQMEMFKGYINKLKQGVGENETSTIISQSIFLLCAGSNDITNTFFLTPFRKTHYNISTYTDMMASWASTFLRELYGMGARRIAVVSAPASGCAPSQRTLFGGAGRYCADDRNQAALLFNAKLRSVLQSLKTQLSGSTIAYLDTYYPLLDVIQRPSYYGFKVVDKGCCGTGKIEVSVLCTRLDPGTCTNASEFVFWDSFHPTEAVYKILVHELILRSINELS